MRVDIFNAFCDGPFTGNPAAVIVLDRWLPDSLLQAIAEQHNLSETAYVLREPGANGRRHLRWFTPAREVRMCGHATLATAAALRSREGHSGAIRFETLSGTLVCTHRDGLEVMDFPADEALAAPDLHELLEQALGRELRDDQVFVGTDDALVVLDEADQVTQYEIREACIARVPRRGLVITAPGPADSDFDVVSRCFYPEFGIVEDPATGSAHTLVGPYWSRRLGRRRLVCLQASRRRGYLTVDFDGGSRVQLSGRAERYLEGRVSLDTAVVF